MNMIAERLDQIKVVLSNPNQTVTHYTIAEIKGEIINATTEELYVSNISWGLNTQHDPGIRGKLNPNIPSTLPANSTTGEIILLTLEINMNAFDAIENMMKGNLRLQYNDASKTGYVTGQALFEITLQQ